MIPNAIRIGKALGNLMEVENGSTFGLIRRRHLSDSGGA
jgi:hypothetical protein